MKQDYILFQRVRILGHSFIDKAVVVGIAVLCLLLPHDKSWASKRFLVSTDSKLTFQTLKWANQNHLSGNFRPQGMVLLEQYGARIEKFLDAVQMVTVRVDQDQKVPLIRSLQGQWGWDKIEEEYMIPLLHPTERREENSGHAEHHLFLTDSLLQSTMKGDFHSIPWGIEAVRAPEAWSKSQYGKNVRVMVIDTGIDKDHPDLVSRFEKGQNFISVDDDVPYDYFDHVSHGTHVAGTIAADGKVTGLIGVAPEARILSARVCSQEGCSSIAIVEAVNWGIEEKVDVMNLSLGGPISSWASAKVFRDASEAGIVVVCSSGNENTDKVRYPAAYETNLAVGAIDEKGVKASFSNWGPELDVMAPGVNIYSSVPRGKGRTSELKVDRGDGQGLVVVSSNPVQGAAVTTQPVLSNDLMSVGLGKKENYQELDVHNKFVLITRGEITFLEKVKNAQEAGASGVIISNNEPGPLAATLGDGESSSLPVLGVSQEVGLELENKKPQSLQILLSATDFELMSGTSMASPHVAGVAALVKATQPHLSAEQIRQILKETAVPVNPNEENKYGSGLIDAEAAVNKAAIYIGEK